MKKIIYLFFTISIFVFSHGAEKKDLPGAWKLVEYINNSTDSNSLNNKVSFMPNFMGDKMSFIQTIEYPNGDVLFERWERLSCEVEKCYKLRSRKD